MAEIVLQGGFCSVLSQLCLLCFKSISTENYHIHFYLCWNVTTFYKTLARENHANPPIYFADKSARLSLNSLQQQLKTRYLSLYQSRWEALNGLATSLQEKGSNHQQISSNVLRPAHLFQQQTSACILLYQCTVPEFSIVRELSITVYNACHTKNFQHGLGVLQGPNTS